MTTPPPAALVGPGTAGVGDDRLEAARALLGDDPAAVVVTVAPELAATVAVLGDEACLAVLPGPGLVPAGLLAAEPAPTAASAESPAAWVAWAYRLQQRGARLVPWPPAPARWPWDGPVVAPVPPGDRHLEPELADTVPIRAWRRGPVRQWSVPTLAVVVDLPGPAGGADPAADPAADLAVERLLAGSWSDLVVVPRGAGAAGVLARFAGDPRVRTEVPGLTPLLLVVHQQHAPDAVGVACLIDRLDRDRLDAVSTVSGDDRGPVLLRRSSLARSGQPGCFDTTAAAAEAARGLPDGWLVQARTVGWSLAGPLPGASWDPARWGAKGTAAEHDHRDLLEREERVAELTRALGAVEVERDRARAQVSVWRARDQARRPRGLRGWGRAVKASLRSSRGSG